MGETRDFELELVSICERELSEGDALVAGKGDGGEVIGRRGLGVHALPQSGFNFKSAKI